MDIIYRIERQDQLYKTLPRALFFSPAIVVFSALTVLLPLSGVFASGSLTVTTNNYTSPCSIPTGNLSTPNAADSTSLFVAENSTVPPYWTGASRKAAELTAQVFLSQCIPDLPQVCGPNCRYKVHIPSFVFQCTPNASSTPSPSPGDSLWNGTSDPNWKWGFYVEWMSTSVDWVGPLGTWGSSYCSPFQAQYDVEVQIIPLSTNLSLIFFNDNSRSR